MRLHGDVELPLTAGDNDGYHHGCYKKFIALAKKGRDLLDQIETSSDLGDNHVTCEDSREYIADCNPCCSKNISSPIKTRSSASCVTACSRTGLFPEVCIFCGLKTKRIGATSHQN